MLISNGAYLKTFLFFAALISKRNEKSEIFCCLSLSIYEISSRSLVLYVSSPALEFDPIFIWMQQERRTKLCPSHVY